MPNVPFSFCHILQFLSHLFLLSTTCCCSISVVYGFNHHPIGSGRAAMTIRRTNGGSHGQILPSQYNDGEPPLSTSFRSCRSNAELFVTKPRTRSFHSNNEVCSTNKWDDRRAVGLFPSKQSSGVSRKRSVMLQMTTSEGGAENHVSNTKESGNKNPLVALWIQMRKLVAKLWTILFLQPLRWIQSLFKNDIGSTDVEVEGKDDGAIGSSSPPTPSAENDAHTISTEKEMEQRHEDVVLTEIENLAADESFDESSPVEVAPTETSPTSPTSETIASTPTTPTTIPPSSQSRRATSAVDLTGNWTLLVDDAFQSQYDEYLRQLGQPLLVRTVASTVIGSTREETRQMDEGRKLYIKGSNVRGSWERTLETSEATTTSNMTTSTSPSSSSTRKRDHAVEGHVLKPMITADDEEVEVASWWEEGGTVHKSWVVGGKKYGGGDFENRRYLTDNGNILVCESTFHPNEEGREKARVTWRFLREGAVYGDAAVEFPNIFDVFGSDEEKKKKKKKKEEEEEEGDSGVTSLSSSEPRMIVGDILDGATTSEEADELEGTSKLDIEAEIERESWVPPSGERWAIAAPGVDLSGKWKLIITEKFKQDYDEFLKSLGQPLIVRGAAVVLIGNTREETKQTDGGRTLYIKGINAKGIWERTLTSSGSDYDTTLTPNADGSYDHVSVPIVTADSEHVMAQSWWENDGTVHVSRTLGVKKYGGGSFESRRYLDPTNGDVYICDSTFHPNDTLEGRERSHLRWKFIREGKSYYVGE